MRIAQLITRTVLLASLWMFLNTSASAATLYGKVVEINDGDTFTIFNLNRPVRVRLLAVDAPDGQQAYAEVAKQHLASLILHRSVTVEYSGLGQNSYLLGKAFLRETDIGAQMLRDGVAWFDVSAGGRLSNSDRQIYVECEQAARSERRGLWQDGEAIAPWEFKQRLATQSLVAKSSANRRVANGTKRTPLLESEDLLRGLTGSDGSNLVSRSTYSTNPEGAGKWRMLAPDGEHFSVQVPGLGSEYSKQVPAGNETVTINYWVSDHEGSSYLVMWTRGPALTYTDASAIQDMANGLVAGLNRGLERYGVDLAFEAKPQRKLTLDGYAGSQFSVSAKNIPGVMRAFSKQVGEHREMYIIGVLNSTEENASVENFFKSLSLDKTFKP